MEENKDLIKEGRNEEVGTTLFVSDGDVVHDAGYHVTPIDDTPVRDQSIVDFMCKDQLISQFSWGQSGTHPKGNVIATLQPAAYLASNAIWANKLQGYNLFRGKACLRVTLNANPFQQGKLIIAFLPFKVFLDTVDSSYSGLHSPATFGNTDAAVCLMSQMPHIIIDCKDSEGKIEIPYCAPTHYYDIKHATYEYGVFFVGVYNPLDSGASGENTVDVSVFLHFEDVELAGPMVAQSTLPSRGRRKIGAKDAELEAVGAHDISRALFAAAKVGDVLSNIPLMSDTMKTLSWTTRTIAGVASALGYSKPLTQSKPEVYTKQFDRYGATCDGVDVTYPLGLSCTNEIGLDNSCSIRDEDEMSMGFLLSRSYYTNTITWSTGTASSDTPLYTTKVAPGLLYVAGSLTKTARVYSLRFGGPMYYLSNVFDMWRGSIKLKGRIAKTPFHTGRLLVTWTPFAGSVVAPTRATSQIAMREIIDIRTSDEFNIVLPFIQPTNYLSPTGYSGQLDFLILNELRAPETCASHVDIMLSWSAGDDFEWQATDAGIMLPFSGQTDRNVVDSVIAGFPQRKVNLRYSGSSTGEICTSIKQLLARNQLINQTTQVNNSNNSLAIYPWLAGVLYGTASTTSGPNAGGDLYSYLSCMYALYRGPVRIKWSGNGSSASNPSVSGIAANMPLQCLTKNVFDVPPASFITALFGNYTWIPTSTAAAQLGAASIAMSNWEGTTGYTVPYYNEYRCSFVMHQTNSNASPAQIDATQPFGMLMMFSRLNMVNYTLCRSFPEDFHLSYFIGCPPVFVSAA